MASSPRILAIAAAFASTIAVAPAQSCRDRLKQPFASTSIWNMPLGTGAAYMPAYIFNQSAMDARHACALRVSTPSFRISCPGGSNESTCVGLGCCWDDSQPDAYTCFQPAGGPPQSFHSDNDWFIVAADDDPLTPFVDQGGWYSPNFDYCNVTGDQKTQYPFPANSTTLCVEDNNSAGLLLPDHVTLVQFQPYFRGTPGSPILGIWAENNGYYPWTSDIRGDGALGAHGGSALSSIGGTIRLGELAPGAGPIQHALKLELFAHDWEWNGGPNNSCVPGGDPSDCCYTWPATKCDGYAGASADGYNGTNPLLKPGSLLAVPQAALPSLNVTTAPGKAILAALSTYGGYIVDDTAWPTAAICMEYGVVDEVKAAYNISVDLHGPDGGASPGAGGQTAVFYWELVQMFRALHIVINNGNGTVGGGGTPIAPLAPPLCE